MARDTEFGNTENLLNGCVGVPLCMAAVVASVMGVALLLGTPIAAYQDWRYARDGVSTESGHVVRKSTRPTSTGDRAETAYYLEIEYTDEGGMPHTASDLVPSEEWERSQVGDRLPPLEYLRGDPRWYRRAADAGQWKGYLFLGCVSLAAAWLFRRAASGVDALARHVR